MSAGAGGAIPPLYNQIVVHVFNVKLGRSIREFVAANFRPLPADSTMGITTTVVESQIETPEQVAAYQSFLTTRDPDFSSVRRATNTPLYKVCSGKINPEYVDDNIRSIAVYGGFILKIYKARGYGDGTPVRTRTSESYPFQLPAPVSNGVLLGVMTVYVKPYGRRERALYIASVCALNLPRPGPGEPSETIKGVASRSIETTYLVAKNLGFNSVKLEALLYCKSPDVAHIRTDACNMWLHDYYISQKFVPDNTHIVDAAGDEILEYQMMTGGAITKVNKRIKEFDVNSNGEQLIAMTRSVV